MLRFRTWWACVLPWPGRKAWEEETIAKCMLLGGVPDFRAVSMLDWDEVWVIEVDNESVITSSNKLACMLAFLKHKGVDV